MRRGHPSKFVKPLAGQTFGFLTVIRRAGSSTAKTGKKKHALWLCRCTCGQEVVARGVRLVAGNRKACAVNGHRWAPKREPGPPGLPTRFPREYQSWESMKRRCAGYSEKDVRNYHGRGIKICDRWKSFEAFLQDMGPKPTPRHTIDRIENNGDYTPENCRWSTYKEQARNKRNSVYVEYEGERLLLLDLVARFGLNRQYVYQRLKIGWTLEEALFIPVKKRK